MNTTTVIHFAELGDMVIRNGMCTCDCGDRCPIGRMGMEYRCTVEELKAAGYNLVFRREGTMIAVDFDKILDRRLDLTREVLAKKGVEYGHGSDRLRAFKEGATVLGHTPELYCCSLMAKHLVSIIDMVKIGKLKDLATRDEKIGDCINYLILLEAILQDTDT